MLGCVISLLRVGEHRLIENMPAPSCLHRLGFLSALNGRTLSASAVWVSSLYWRS